MKMRTTYTLGPLCLVVVFTLISCQDSIVFKNLTEPTDEPPEDETVEPIEDPQEETNKGIYIVDRTGKRWDITHAVHYYRFDPEKFQFGHGPDAIKPILDPQMLCPGDDGYLEDNDPQLVLGVSLDDTARACISLIHYGRA